VLSVLGHFLSFPFLFLFNASITSTFTIAVDVAVADNSSDAGTVVVDVAVAVFFPLLFSSFYFASFNQSWCRNAVRKDK
jgi:hypothetical protein